MQRGGVAVSAVASQKDGCEPPLNAPVSCAIKSIPVQLDEAAAL